MLKGEGGQESQTNRLCSPQQQKKRNNKTGLISSLTLVSPALGSHSHMLNVTVCLEIAPRRLCSCQASEAADIYHLWLTLLAVFRLQGVDAELPLCQTCVVFEQILIHICT